MISLKTYIIYSSMMISIIVIDMFGGPVITDFWAKFKPANGRIVYANGCCKIVNDAASSVTVQLISGDQSDTTSGNTTMYSIVATHDFTENLHYLLQHDYANQDAEMWASWGDF
jgi:hypothetical protein